MRAARQGALFRLHLKLFPDASRTPDEDLDAVHLAVRVRSEKSPLRNDRIGLRLTPELMVRLDALINQETVAGNRYGDQANREVDTETFAG